MVNFQQLANHIRPQGTPQLPQSPQMQQPQGLPQPDYGRDLARLQAMQQQMGQDQIARTARTQAQVGRTAPTLGQSLAPAPQVKWSDQPWARYPNGQLNEKYNPRNYVGGWYWDPNDMNHGGG